MEPIDSPAAGSHEAGHHPSIGGDGNDVDDPHGPHEAEKPHPVDPPLFPWAPGQASLPSLERFRCQDGLSTHKGGAHYRTFQQGDLDDKIAEIGNNANAHWQALKGDKKAFDSFVSSMPTAVRDEVFREEEEAHFTDAVCAMELEMMDEDYNRNLAGLKRTRDETLQEIDDELALEIEAFDEELDEEFGIDVLKTNIKLSKGVNAASRAEVKFLEAAAVKERESVKDLGHRKGTELAFECVKAKLQLEQNLVNADGEFPETFFQVQQAMNRSDFVFVPSPSFPTLEVLRCFVDKCQEVATLGDFISHYTWDRDFRSNQLIQRGKFEAMAEKTLKGEEMPGFKRALVEVETGLPAAIRNHFQNAPSPHSKRIKLPPIEEECKVLEAILRAESGSSAGAP